MTLRSKFLTVLIAGASFGCGESQPSENLIVGGAPVGADEVFARSTVALVNSRREAFCTGTLIGARHVLTAAHCLELHREGSIYILFGTDAELSPKTTHRMRISRQWRMHEAYDRVAVNADEPKTPPRDIAVVYLEEPAPPPYQPAFMAPADLVLTKGEPIWIAGFGRRFWSATQGGSLYKAEVKLAQEKPDAHELESGDVVGKSACVGDSGGPLFAKRGAHLFLIGVTSRGGKFCDQNSLHTDVRRYLNWIR